jgi:hypothetical protein
MLVWIILGIKVFLMAFRDGLRQLSTASFRYDFRGLKELLSSGCCLWLQCTGRHNNWIPKSSATSNTALSKWLRCPSRTNRGLPGNRWLLKWFKNLQNSSFVKSHLMSYQKCLHWVDVTKFFLWCIFLFLDLKCERTNLLFSSHTKSHMQQAYYLSQVLLLQSKLGWHVFRSEIL